MMSSHCKRIVRVGSVLVLVLIGLATLPAATRAADALLQMHAFAVNVSGLGRTRTETLNISIERWTTDAERKVLVDTLIEKGKDALLDAVEKIKPRAGFIRTSTSLGWAIQYAREVSLPNGGKRIIIATDRPMSFYEMTNNTRSADYDFMLAEIRLGPDGKGEGKLVPAAKISYDQDKRQVEIENYANEPVRLTQVVVDKK
jgi:hypothetical protein